MLPCDFPEQLIVYIVESLLFQGVNEQLRLAGESFLEGDDGLQINMSKKEVKLSMIFKWYREDFGRSDEEVMF